MKRTLLIYFGLIIFSFQILKANVSSKISYKDSNAYLKPPKPAFFTVDTLYKIPNELKAWVKGDILRVVKVDFNGDGTPDYIFQYKPFEKLGKADFFEDWITSERKTIKTKKRYSVDIEFCWFMNIDGDPEPEIFFATGYEDGIDYAFYDQDLKSGNDKLLFYFNPIIIENGKYYWGYPWDIKDIILNVDSKSTYLKASLDHNIERDGMVTIPDSTKKFPAIFFYGHSTQPNFKIESLRNIKWLTLAELTN